MIKSQQQQDPLRFLKPRKKQFHLTPSKVKGDTSTNSIKDSTLFINDNSKVNNNKSKQKQHQHKGQQNINRKYLNRTSNQSQLILQSKRTEYLPNNGSKQQSQNLITNNSKNRLEQNRYQGNFDNKDNSNKIYNPEKYFSLKIENFLLSKYGSKNTNSTDNKQQPKQPLSPISNRRKQQLQIQSNRVNKIYQHKQQQLQQGSPYFQQISKRQNQFIIPLKINNNQSLTSNKYDDLSQNTMRLEDYFENSSRLETQKTQNSEYGNNKAVNNKQLNNKRSVQREVNTMTRDNRIQQNKNTKINQKPTNQKFKLNNATINKKQQNILSKPSQSQSLQNDIYLKQNNYNQFQPCQLKQCQICHRKFNPISYQKHVKVCEKVFYKKRKQFSSQKQRSKSKNKNEGNKK